MMEFIKLAGGVAAAVIASYMALSGSVTDHGHRIDRLEMDWSGHLARHEAQYEKIDTRLDEIAQALARMSGDDDSKRVGMMAGKR